MAGCIKANNLKKVVLGVVIALVAWSAIVAQQTSSSQKNQPSQAEETIGLPPKIDQLKALRDQAEAAKDLSESDKKNVLISLVRGIHLIEETERLNVETQQSTDFIIC
ncbi:MAG: hypothetical protein P8X86_16520 [Desulfofustis sp.]